MCCNNIVQLSLNQIDLRFKKFRSCSDSVVSKMVQSLRKRGQLTPLVVGLDNRVHVLVDGFKRYRAADSLSIKTLSALITPHQGSLMKSQVYLLNHGSDFNLIDEGLLIRELVEKDGLSQVEISSLLDRHKSWVCRRLSIINNLEPQIIEDIQLGLIPVGCALWLAQLPRCNQGDVGSVIQSFNLGVKESKRLIDLWRKNLDAEKRQFLIDYPRQALQLSDGANIDSSGLSKLFRTVRYLTKLSDSLLQQSFKLEDPLKSNYFDVIKSNLDIMEERFNKGLNAVRNILPKRPQKEAEGPDCINSEKPGEQNKSSVCSLGHSGLSAIS